MREVVGLKTDDLRGERQRRLFRALAARFRDVPLVDLHGTLRTRLLSLFWKGTVYRYPKYALTRRLFLLSGDVSVARRFWPAMFRNGMPPRWPRSGPRGSAGTG